MVVLLTLTQRQNVLLPRSRRGLVRILDRQISWLAITALIFLSACSNGRGTVSEGSTPVSGGPTQPTPQPPPAPPPSPPTPPPTPPPNPTPPTVSAFAGYWNGHVVAGKGDSDDDGRSTRDATAFVDQSGETHLIVTDEAASEFVVYGNGCCEASISETFGGTRYLDTREEEADFAASLSGGGMTGAVEFRKDDYQFSLASSSAYTQSLGLQDLAGVYTRTTTRTLGSPLTLTLAIDADGRITGSHSNGCVFEGSASIPDASRNMVRFTMSVANCGEQFGSSSRWNGDYTGLGVLLRDAPAPDNAGTREDTLLLSLVGPTWLGLLSVGK